MEQGSKFHPEKLAEQKESVISRPEIQEFIKSRKIDPADFAIIEKLAGFSKNLIIMKLHNTFSMVPETSIANVERWAKNAPDDESKDLYETILVFAKKYGPDTSHILVRILEDL